MSGYFQEGQVAGLSGDELVWKLPRASACVHCLRIHTNADGSPRKYKLADVEGNSNSGLPAFAWGFTIGPTHPYCYCVLFRETQKQGGPNQRLATARAQFDNLSKSLDKKPCLDPYTTYEEAHCSDGEPDPAWIVTGKQ